jgi:glycosyltransferase involved in cell wall biosynthesis
VGLCPAPTRLEVFPNKAFLYLAAGLPVISAFGGDLAELIQRHDFGVDYEPGDSAALVEAIERLHDDATMRSRMSANAARVWQQLFDADRITEQCADHVEAAARRHSKLGHTA